MNATAAKYRNGTLSIEDTSLEEIASAVGTPVYVYSSEMLKSQYLKLDKALDSLPHQLHYAVKANSTLAVLKTFAELGAGFDIVSGGELSRVLAAGGNPESVVFSGVGKSVEEIDFALKTGIECFNVESDSELMRISQRAEVLGKIAPIALRINPNVDPKTHPYISTGLKENKFGILQEAALALYQQAHADPNLHVRGVACHIGSQISDPTPLFDTLDQLLALIDQLADQGIQLTDIDLGGGFGVTYQDEASFDVNAWGIQVIERLASRGLTVSIEPGRFLTANAGVLLTRVEYLKPSGAPAQADEGHTDEGKNFAIVDAAMNDLLRPSLYQAWHGVLAVQEHSASETRSWDLVGPICESGDWLAKNRILSLAEGDLLAILSAGAYGSSLSSNYNTRNRAAEVMVRGDSFRVVRRRESLQDQLTTEIL
ncbi:MAG: diaminopimelate decarboxylase [Gammaproteobacteria bacterium TMED243]|nr:diaminopimelate decarboxylase [Gammaproteobacteria bacterium]RPG31333.1 MAG: diaminopimelate decarboxylase [Gammaproteobacteria bacterium TMED243]